MPKVTEGQNFCPPATNTTATKPISNRQFEEDFLQATDWQITHIRSGHVWTVKLGNCEAVDVLKRLCVRYGTNVAQKQQGKVKWNGTMGSSMWCSAKRFSHQTLLNASVIQPLPNRQLHVNTKCPRFPDRRLTINAKPSCLIADHLNWEKNYLTRHGSKTTNVM